MSGETTLNQAFGCEHCWPSTAAAALRARDTFDHQERLIDESHFGVNILACPACAQRFVAVFTERIDWIDGDDPQEFTLLPITETEAVMLSQAGSALKEADLDTIGPGRRSLCFDCPKGAEARCYWSTGIMVGPHD
jgi:hypothetical protein